MHRILPLTPAEKARIRRTLREFVRDWTVFDASWNPPDVQGDRATTLTARLSEILARKFEPDKLPAVHDYVAAVLPDVAAVFAAALHHKLAELEREEADKRLTLAAVQRGLRLASVEELIRLTERPQTREREDAERTARYEQHARWHASDDLWPERHADTLEDKLRRMTLANGCTPGEVAAAQAILARRRARARV